MVSKQQMFVWGGLPITVFGLDEHKAKGVDQPVAVVFALHGRLQSEQKMQPIAEALCGLNEAANKRHLIVVTFDHPNHGQRLRHKQANYAWKEGRHENPDHALDMWAMLYSSSRTISDLIDVLEYYLFDRQTVTPPRIQAWGVLGFSMGGHAAFMAAAEDPRITVSIPIVGTADFLGLLRTRLQDNGLSSAQHLPASLCEAIQRRTDRLEDRLKDTKLLIISGEKDKLVPAASNAGFVQRLRQVHKGSENEDWQYIVVPDVGHEWCPTMVNESVQWCQRWLLQQDEGQCKL
ncbi:Alpha/Beta hydrolase protein [Radiomyces spectabilis]|uniref:Alpha/Beta hydrolase protein n=1 Tax=Radiomyces spectabilis TaxID=64574 RepID=UPI00221E4FC3|nr:Alpha/Beta hydrolase protein [Radiomyces spectabilis]KAI8372885.1 Alpha/Beta hydrolase protein [Radiomyces spectabilis]